MTHVILVLVTILIAWFLPREDEMERRTARAIEAQPAVTP
jgi:hypothetical protein